MNVVQYALSTDLQNDFRADLFGAGQYHLYTILSHLNKQFSHLC